MRAGFALLVALAGAALPAAALAAAPSPQGSPELYLRTIRPLTQKYCFGCHSPEKLKGDVDLTQYANFQDVRKDAETWELVAEKLEAEEMPPDGKPQPTAAQRAQMVGWTEAVLDAIEHEHDGEPGRVVLRRLTNAEYTYTVRDLTGVESLDPAREFPSDSAAGEGFLNVGQALVMSPALFTQYFNAATAIASHAVLLPDGIGFSAKTTRRDFTEEIETRIRNLYRLYADVPPDVINLHGVTNDEANNHEPAQGGRLPLARCLAALERERPGLLSGGKTPAGVAQEYGLSPKYLEMLWNCLEQKKASPFFDRLRADWRSARPEDLADLKATVAQWQEKLWTFNFVGMLDDQGRPKAWMAPVPLVAEEHDLRLTLNASPAGDAVVAYLAAGDAGGGPAGEAMEWRDARLVHPGQPTIRLRDVREYVRELTRRRNRILGATTRYLAAAAEVSSSQGDIDLAALAQRRRLDPAALQVWLDYLGLGLSDTIRLADFTHPLVKMTNWDYVNGWGSLYAPGMVANSSYTQMVRIPGIMPPRSVGVQPSAAEYAAAGWRSPIGGTVRVDAAVFDEFPEINHGFIWSLELRHGRHRQRLATGVPHLSKTSPNYGKFENGPEVTIAPVDRVVAPGDLISLVIGPWEGDNIGDLIGLQLKIKSVGPNSHEWSLTREVSGDVLAGNPHADDAGHPGVWHFYSEPFKDYYLRVIPPGSLLARWLAADSPEEKHRLAKAVRRLLTSNKADSALGPDAELRRQLTSLASPFLARDRRELAEAAKSWPTGRSIRSGWGLDPSRFGRRSRAAAGDPYSLFVQAPSVTEVRLPADLFAGSELLATARIGPDPPLPGPIQPQILAARPAPVANLRPGWPILAQKGSPAWTRMLGSCDAFRRIFPPALCYSDIVPIDEGETLVQFHRDDRWYSDLMLNEAQQKQLDRLWDDLEYVSREPLNMVDIYEDIFAPPDVVPPKWPRGADPRVAAAAAARQPKALGAAVHRRGAAFQQRLLDTEPKHLQAILEFAGRAYRRPLTGQEKSALLECYRQLRQLKLSHEEAVRLTLARVLVAPAFLYRLESPAPGPAPAPVTGEELATRLSYFLWSSEPDAELRAAADSGKLSDPAVLAAQTRRMLSDPRVRHLATEFACQWLQIHDFDQYDEKSARAFPTFAGLRGDMYEESVEFLTDLFRSDRPVLNLIDADYTFLNEKLARHYGIPGVKGAEWRRVDGIRKYSRGGIFGQAAFLSKRAGASRSSPILRGSWIATIVLGVNVPPPPKVVPQLPDNPAVAGLSVRQLTERHVSDPNCSVCHARFDAYGFALEEFDGIGRFRQTDSGDNPIDTRAKLPDGAEIDGLSGLRNFLLAKRRDAFVAQFCRKLLGYALGRSVQFSDEPLIRKMKAQLAANHYRVDAAIEAVVQSSQFREIRGGQIAAAE